MILLSSVIETFKPAFVEKYQGSILPSHLHALDAMQNCRTTSSPLMLAECVECEHQIFVPHSCGHRNCPHCQHHESQQWLERQLQKQVPAEYFLLTFTLPAEFRTLAGKNQRTVYSLMVQCAWETVRTFAQNDKQLQGVAGAIAVLHTHSRSLDYHPHVHLLMPAAAIDEKQKQWRTKEGYLFSGRALAKVFRAKMLDAITREQLILPERHRAKWIVHCKSVGTGDKALIYLGRYLYRGVIREKDILACDNGQVTFSYQDGKTKRILTKTVPGAQFLWLLVQHVLPKNFRRARNFGFLHSNSKRLLQVMQYLLGVNLNRVRTWFKKRPSLKCSICGSKMRILATRIPPFFLLPPTTPIGNEPAGALAM